MILIAGFFACLFIRELDFITDKIHFLSWFHCVLAVVLVCTYVGINNRENTLKGLYHFCKSESYYIMVCGLLTILVFSRILGMKILWKGLFGKEYLRVVKNAVEEVTELIGYAFCLISTLKYLRYTCSIGKKAASDIKADLNG